jgi:hypothetical protein
MVRKLDIGVAAALIVICVAVFLESLSMPPAFYDPIGPAAFRSPSGKSSKTDRQPTDRQPTYRPRPDLAVGAAILTGIYVLVLTLRLLSYGVITAAFLISFIMLMMPFGRKQVLIAIIIALIMGFGGGYIFTHVFYIDLP